MLSPIENPATECSPALLTFDSNNEERRVVYIRKRYVEKLSHHSLVTSGFVPNLYPIIQHERDESNVPRPRGECVTGGRDLRSVVAVSSGGGGASRSLPMLTVEPMAQGSEGGQREVVTTRPFLAAGSVKSSVFNLTSATLGAGALSLPFAMYNSGILCGVCLLLFIGVLSRTTTMFVVKTVEYTELKSFEEMAVLLHGTLFALWAELNIVMFCFGTSVGYLISIGDVCDIILPQQDALGPLAKILLSRNCVITISTFCILLPMCLLERLEELRFTCFLGVSAIAFLCAVVTLNLFNEGMALAPHFLRTAMLPLDRYSTLRAVVLLTFAFSCQANVPAIYCELESQNLRRMEKVTSRAVVLCFGVYSVIGVVGYLTWGRETMANIMSNYEDAIHHSWLFASALVGMGVAITFAYPTNIFPCRFAVEMLLIWRWPFIAGKSTQTIIAVTTVLLTFVCAIYVPSISLVFGLVGATSGCFVTFLFPSYAYIKLLPGSITHIRKLQACGIVLFGILVTGLGTAMAVVDILNAYYPPQEQQQVYLIRS